MCSSKASKVVFFQKLGLLRYKVPGSTPSSLPGRIVAIRAEVKYGEVKIPRVASYLGNKEADVGEHW